MSKGQESLISVATAVSKVNIKQDKPFEVIQYTFLTD